MLASPPCRKGHTEGRYSNGKCKVCHKANVIASQKRKHRPPTWSQRKVPSAPIRGRLERAFDLWETQETKRSSALRRQYQTRFDLDYGQVRRDFTAVLRNDTITIELADRFAVFLGLHLDLLFDPAVLHVGQETSA